MIQTVRVGERLIIGYYANLFESAAVYESSSERWSPVQSIEKILLSVVSMLAEPNVESGANIDACVRRSSYLVGCNYSQVFLMMLTILVSRNFTATTALRTTRRSGIAYSNSSPFD